MKKLDRWLGIVVCVAVGCTPAAEDNPTGNGTSADALTALAGDSPARMQAQLALASDVDDVEAQAATDPQFAHVAVDPDTHGIIVYRVGGASSAMQTHLAAAVSAGTRIEIRAAQLTQTEVNDLAARLDADHDALATDGVAVTSWGPDGEGGPFRVGVTGDITVARARLEARYPAFAHRILVENVEHVPVSRLADTSPYWGGDRIITASTRPGYVNECTGGFAGENANGRYMITAAHCNCNAGRTVWNGQGHTMGTFSGAVDRNLDAAFVIAPTSTAVFTDTVSSPNGSYSFVHSMGHPRVGQYVCTSGSFRDLRCNARVQGWTHVLLPTCVGNEVVAEWYADQVHHYSLIGHGDSGGPVFVRESGNQVSARGLISSMDGAHNATCPDGHAGCSYRVYFPDIVPIAQRHGLALTGF